MPSVSGNPTGIFAKNILTIDSFIYHHKITDSN